MEQKKEDIFDRLMHLPGLRIFEKFYKKNKEVLLYLLFGGTDNNCQYWNICLV